MLVLYLKVIFKALSNPSMCKLLFLSMLNAQKRAFMWEFAAHWNLELVIKNRLEKKLGYLLMESALGLISLKVPLIL
jgi:hypothetical protein